MIGQRIGNYRVVRQLGEGGMGVVYEAVRDDIGSRAAVKVLRPEFALRAETAARFFNEARAANLIDHPSIVKIFDYGQLPDGVPYLAMELLSGESLHQRMQRERRVSEPDTIRLGRQVATALAAAHAKAVIHRDLKPENIFIVPDAEASGGERAKILDFGIAKLTDNQPGALRTGTNVVMGTPIYMSPEQCKGGKHVDERADIYALGVILFEMLAGRPPFVAEEAGEYIGMHLLKAPPPLGSLMPTTSVALQRLVDSMLIKDPQQRPAAKVVTAVLKSLGNLTSDIASISAFELDDPALLDTRRDGRGRELPTPNLRPLAYQSTDPAPPPVAMVRPSQEVTNPRPNNQQVAPAADVSVPAAPPPGAFLSGDGQEDPTAMMGAANLPTMLPTPASKLPAEWQPILRLPAAPAIGNLNPDSGSQEATDKPKRSVWKRLRRLRFQIKKRIFLWLGVSISDLRTTPSELQKADRRIVIGLGIVALALLTGIVFLLVRKPVERVTHPSVPPPPPPQVAPADLGPAPLAKDEVAVDVPDKLATLLAAAQAQADNGKKVTAMKSAREAAKKYPHPAAWVALGKYACVANRRDRVNEALSHLVDDSPASRQGAAAVHRVCGDPSDDAAGAKK